MLSLKPVALENQIWYVGESYDLFEGLIHVFGVHCLVSCNQTGEQKIWIPIPTSSNLFNDQIVGEGVSVFNFFQSIQSALTNKDLNADDYEFVNYSLDLNSQNRFKNLYPNCQTLAFSFDYFEGFRNFSILFSYKPTRSDAFFVPTKVMSMKGKDFDEEVYCNHWIAMSTQNMRSGKKPKYYLPPSAKILNCIPNLIIGKKFDGWHKNEDTIAAVKGVEVGLHETINRKNFLEVWPALV